MKTVRLGLGRAVLEWYVKHLWEGVDELQDDKVEAVDELGSECWEPPRYVQPLQLAWQAGELCRGGEGVEEQCQPCHQQYNGAGWEEKLGRPTESS